MLPAWSRAVFLIGLTGAIGSGKSTAARLFEKHGAIVVDADRLAKEALTLPDVQTLLRAKFPEAFEAAGLSHSRLANIVFENRERLAELTAITHPVVRRAFQAEVEKAQAGAIVVYDVPLLFEAGLERDFDLTVCVAVEESLRHRRLLERGLTENDIKRREGLQLKAAEKEKRAGFLLKNDGNVAGLEGQVVALLKEIEARRTV
jgi:dephospho-CoA kinase